MKEAFFGDTISNVQLSGDDSSMVLSFEQRGSVKDCSKDLAGLFPKSSLTADTRHSLFRGTITSLKDSFAFISGSKKVKGSYTFASVNASESASVDFGPEKKVTSRKTQALSNREVSRLLRSDETVQDFCQFSVSGDKMELTYEGSTAASHWFSIAQIAIPLILCFGIALFILIRRQWIASKAIKIKDWIEEKISDHKKE